MKQAFKKNKELDIDHIESLQDDLVDIMVGWAGLGLGACLCCAAL